MPSETQPGLMRLGDVCEIFDGPHATPKKIEEGPFFLSISSLDNGRLDLSRSAHLSEEDFAKWTRRVTPREGDVVFSYETRLGEAALVPAGLRCCLGRRMGLLRPKAGELLPRFLLYAFLAPRFQRVITERQVSGSTVPRILLTEMGDYPIEVPPLDDQRRTVEVLGSLDEKVESNERLASLLEETAATLFRARFVDFVGVSDLIETEIGPIPAGWRMASLSDLISVTRGISYKSADFGESEVALVGLKAIQRGGGYTSRGIRSYTGPFKKEHVLATGDILVAHTDLTQGAAVLGAPARVPSWEAHTRLVPSLDLAIVRPREGVATGEYLLGVLSTEAFKNHARARSSGTTVLHLARGAVGEFPMAVPPASEITEYTSQVRPILQMADALRGEAQTLAALRDGLLPRLISGQGLRESLPAPVEIA